MQHRQKMDRLLSLHLLSEEFQRFLLKFRNIENSFIKIQLRYSGLIDILRKMSEQGAILLPFLTHRFPAARGICVPLIRRGPQVLAKERSPSGVVLEIPAVHIHMDHQCQRLDLRVLRVLDIGIEQVSEISHEISDALLGPHCYICSGRMFIFINALCDQGNKTKPLFLPDPKQVLHRVFPESALPEFLIVRRELLGNILLGPDCLDPPRSVYGSGFLPLPAAQKLIVPKELARDPVPVIEEIRHLLHRAEVLSPDPRVEHAHGKIRSPDQVLIDGHYVVGLKVFLGSVFDRDQSL